MNSGIILLKTLLLSTSQVNLLRHDKYFQFLLSLIPGAVMAFTVWGP